MKAKRVGKWEKTVVSNKSKFYSLDSESGKRLVTIEFSAWMSYPYTCIFPSYVEGRHESFETLREAKKYAEKVLGGLI